MKKRLPIIVIVVILVVVLGSVRLKRMKQKNNSPLLESVPMTVETAVVTQQPITAGRHVLGEITGADEVEIAPRIMARVLEVEVREGERVARGQVLALLDAREQRDALAAAKAGREAAEIAARTQSSATARDKVLYEAEAISQEQWDRSRALEASFTAKLAAAVNNEQRAETRLSYTKLRAPVAGLVARRLADPGDLAMPGKPLLEVVRQAEVRVRGKLPQDDLSRLAVGQGVTLTVGDQRTAAAISRIFPATDRNHLAVFEVDLAAPPAGYVAGMTVGVDLAFTTVAALAVPVAALLDGENGSWIFRIRDRKIQPVAVKVLSTGSENVAVSGDLAVGDLVVTARPSRLMMLSEGETVRVAQQGSRP